MKLFPYARTRAGLAVFFVVCSFGLTMLMARSAAAAQVGVGFFEDRDTAGTLTSIVECGAGPQSWHKVLCNGINDYSGDKQGFINDIKGKLQSGDEHISLGAAFIVYTMLGYEPGNNRSPSSEEIADWEARINNPAITIESHNVTAYPNSVYVRYAADGVSDVTFINDTAYDKPSLVFKYNGADVYYLKLECANPLGDMPGLPEAASWDASGRSTVNDQNEVKAIPGETVTFKHYIKNIGNKDISGLDWKTFQDGASQATGAVNLAQGAEKKVREATFTVPLNAHVGDEYCQEVVFQDSEANTDDESSGGACVKVKSNFDVFPKVTNGTDDVTALMPGQTTTMNGFTVNTGATADRTATYEIEQFVVPGGVSKPVFGGVFNKTGSGTRYANASHADKTSCTGWLKGQYGAATITDCKELSYVTNYTYGAGTVPLPALAAINADDYNPGDWVCQFISVSDYRYIVTEGYANPHRVSYPICVVIAKQPSVQVWGDDVHVGDNYLSATSGGESLLNDSASVITSTGRAKRPDGVVSTFGSWAEYGIFAPAPNGIIKSVSGGAISGTNGSEPDLTPASLANSLSFSNTEPGYFGKWTAPRTIDSIEKFVEQYPEGTANSSDTIHLDQLTANSGVHDGDIKRVALTHGGNISIAGSMAVNATAILVTDQTVKITNDIVAPAANQTITGIGTAPQLIIIANNIVIDSGVKNVDAWLIARPSDPTETLNGLNGKISTCDSIKQSPDNYYDGLKLSTCNQPLRINGAVIAKEVQFRRTYGANKVDGLATAAEIINLRADAFMWARPAANAGGGMPIKTTMTTELPPRF